MQVLSPLKVRDLTILLLGLAVISGAGTAIRLSPQAADVSPMELVYMSRAGVWHVAEQGTVTLDASNHVLSTRVSDGVVDAALFGDASMDVLAPDGLYRVMQDSGRMISTCLLKLPTSFRYKRIIGHGGGVWLESAEGIDCIENGNVTLHVTPDELTNGLGLPTSPKGRRPFPVMDCDTVGSTAYIVLRRGSRDGVRYIILDPTTRRWSTVIDLDDTTVAPLVVDAGRLLLLDGSWRRFCAPAAVLKGSANQSTRNLYANLGNSQYVSSVWRSVLGKARAFVLLLDISKEKTLRVNELGDAAKSRVYADTTGCYRWPPSWYAGTQVLSITLGH